MSAPRSLDDGPWLWLSHAAHIRAKRAAGAQGLAVMVALAAMEPKSRAEFYASARNIADGCGLSQRTVERVLPVLVTAKLIAVQSGRGAGAEGQDVANKYRLLAVNLSIAEGGTGRAPQRHTDTETEATDTETEAPPSHRRTRTSPSPDSLAVNRAVSARSRETAPSACAPAPMQAPGAAGKGGWL